MAGPPARSSWLLSRRQNKAANKTAHSEMLTIAQVANDLDMSASVIELVADTQQKTNNKQKSSSCLDHVGERDRVGGRDAHKRVLPKPYHNC